MVNFPVDEIEYYTKKHTNNHTILCIPYDKEEMYAFYCSRYKDISFKEFMQLGYDEFLMKLNSIPESEPLYKIIKSRSLDINKIKDKEERKYWRELKELNRIPDIYLPNEELDRELKDKVKKEGITNVK